MSEAGHRYRFTVILVSYFVLIIMGCSFLSRKFTTKREPLSFVGKIIVGQPITEDNITKISLEFKGGKWPESSRILTEVTAFSHEQEIYFTVVTCIATEELKKVSPEIRLKGLEPGKYRLIYQNPDQVSIMLGEIEIE